MRGFSPATPTSRGCTQLLLACCRLHYILQSGRGKGRQLNCLRCLRSSRQVDCARKNLQLRDLTVLTKSLELLDESPLSIGRKRTPFFFVLQNNNVYLIYASRQEHSLYQCCLNTVCASLVLVSLKYSTRVRLVL